MCMFCHLATIGFIVWMLLVIDFPADNCLSVSYLDILCPLNHVLPPPGLERGLVEGGVLAHPVCVYPLGYHDSMEAQRQQQQARGGGGVW